MHITFIKKPSTKVLSGIQGVLNYLVAIFMSNLNLKLPNNKYTTYYMYYVICFKNTALATRRNFSEISVKFDKLKHHFMILK